MLRNVQKAFVTGRGRDRRAALAVQDVSLEIQPGEFVSFIGPSGCGKSTVLNMLAGLERASAGEVRQGASPIDRVNTNVGYMTQDDNLLPWRTLARNVEFPLEIRGVPRRTRAAEARRILAQVGLERYGDYYPHQLSGGMRKRGALVRTLLADDPVILMDEPFGPLDAQNRRMLQDQLLHLWSNSGKTIVFVTHDLVEAVTLSDRIVVFTSAPGTIKRVHTVDLPRPRDVFRIHETPGFDEIYNPVWDDLREEIAKVASVERQAS